MTTDSAVLEPRVVDAIRGQFVVPSYQRGYRWGPAEVGHLLDDILASVGRYYLQPIVVKDVSGRWMLIDGQQRLTTLLLVLNYLRVHVPTLTVNYTLEYETRHDSAAFVQDPVAERSQENIDFFHIHQAAEVIRTWFEGQPNPTLAAMNFYTALCERVHIIWYEAPAELEPRTLFTRLNVGRIPLTDAELVKATLLSRVSRPEEVAAQWDAIERDLREPELWSFITASDAGVPTHIELLLDTLAGGPRGRRRRPFHTYETMRERLEATHPDELWDEIVDLHALLRGWFEDRDVFHKVGFLMTTSESFARLVEAGRTLTKSAFAADLDDRIRRQLNLTRGDLHEIGYEHEPAKCSQVLTLFNVETVRRRTQSRDRYSFAAQARNGWSLEHIDAQSAEPLTRVEQWSDWLRLHRDALYGLPGLDEQECDALVAEIDAALPDITNHQFQELEARIGQHFRTGDDGTGEWAHRLANLALLDGDANSALSNSCFEVKRRQILRLDRDGRDIPPGTRNVFLKYYTEAGAQQIHFWGPHDRETYMAAMAETLAPYLLASEDEPPAADAPRHVQ